MATPPAPSPPMPGIVARSAAGTEHLNTLRPTLRYTLQGKLFYKRTWDYNTSGAGGPFKEYLPAVKVELWIQRSGRTEFARHADGALTSGGEFRFADVPRFDRAAVKFYLQHVTDAVVIKGMENLVTRDDYRLRRGEVVWRRVELDMARRDAATDFVVDFGDVEIAPTAPALSNITHLCDCYKSTWRGWRWIKEHAKHTLPSCVVNYPQRGSVSFHRAGELFILEGDARDKDVQLHEYGHFIGHTVLGGLTHPGYNYNDDVTNGHNPASSEHYESAWNEGHATFLSSAISDDPIYRDGYDASLTMDLATDNITVGPHCEGSIQAVLWQVHKAGVKFDEGFWKAFSHAARKCETVFAFYDNWRDAGCPNLAALKAAMTAFNCHIGYRYTRSLVHDAAQALDPANPTRFATVAELFNAYGTASGGTLADYREEFYNRNRYVGGGAFAAGATVAAFTLIQGTTYIVPERFEIT